MKILNFDKQANKDKFIRLSAENAFSLLDSEGETSETTTNLKPVGGYFVVFNVLSTKRYREDGSMYLVIIPPNSMRLPDYDVVSYYNHNEDIILGRVSNGTLSIAQDSVGCKMALSMTDTQTNRDYHAQILAKDINGMSPGMYVLKKSTETRVIKAEDVHPESGLSDLIGKEVEVEIYEEWLLDEITVTPRAAFPQTTLEALAKDKEPTQEVELNKADEKGLIDKNDEIRLARLKFDFLALSLD